MGPRRELSRQWISGPASCAPKNTAAACRALPALKDPSYLIELAHLSPRPAPTICGGA
jgi:hypothetical protein